MLIIYWVTNNNHFFGEQFYWMSEANPITLSEPKKWLLVTQYVVLFALSFDAAFEAFWSYAGMRIWAHYFILQVINRQLLNKVTLLAISTLYGLYLARTILRTVHTVPCTVVYKLMFDKVFFTLNLQNHVIYKPLHW